MGKEQTEGCVRKIEATLGTGDSVYKIVDNKVTLLIAAGSAIAANCEPCLVQ